MQQSQDLTIAKISPIINRALKHLMTADSRPLAPHVKLLNPQPAKQRRLFLHKAIADHLRVTFQLMPTTADGFPVNVTGRVKALTKSRYLITSRNTFYLVNFDQIRYIANL